MFGYENVTAAAAASCVESAQSVQTPWQELTTVGRCVSARPLRERTAPAGGADGKMTEVRWSIEHEELIVGVVIAREVTVAESGPDLSRQIDEVAGERASGWPPPDVKKAVRDLLRGRGYKPAGRGKPASEYLAGVAKRGDFPRINNVVDINNLLSLRTGWPMSALDLDRAQASAEALEIRYGREAERYVFNSVGQEIDLKGLLGVARAGGEMVGNPVKDAMAAKTDEATRNVVGAIYTSRQLASERQVASVATEYAELLERYAGAAETRVVVLPGGST